MAKLIEVTCEQCGKIINRENRKRHSFHLCSNECKSKHKNTKQTLNCTQCDKTFQKQSARIKKSKNHFCSKSCSTTYNNLNKKHGTRRSKLEAWLEEQLPKLYPDLEFKFNSKEAINSELDIYIPELRLAFELNGIYHYEPIHGQDKLDKIQKNDQNKFQACINENISLCIIDTSSQKYVKPKTSQKFLDIICKIINSNLNEQ